MSKYFTYLPEVNIRKTGFRNDSTSPYYRAKNLFRRIKIRDNLTDIILGFEKYYIKNGERPDQLSQKFYGTTQYDWVILLCNNIINIYQDWPVTETELYEIVKRKYGFTSDDQLGGVHHYVTQEVKHSNGMVLVPADLEVSDTFTYTRSDGTVVPREQLIRPISYYEHEMFENERKRMVYILKRDYLNDFKEEFFQLTQYLPSDEVDEETGVKTTFQVVEENFTAKKEVNTSDIGKTPSINFLADQQFTNRVYSSTAEAVTGFTDASSTLDPFSAAGSFTLTSTDAATNQSASSVGNTQTNTNGY